MNDSADEPQVETGIGNRLLFASQYVTNPTHKMGVPNWWSLENRLLDNVPYAGHKLYPFSTGSTEARDLNYQTQDEYQIADIYTTNNNMYDRFWKEYVNNINNPLFKVITGKFKLTEDEYSSLKFNDVIVFKESYWRLNSIQYIIGEDIHEVQLYKILDDLDSDFKIVDNHEPTWVPKPYSVPRTHWINSIVGPMNHIAANYSYTFGMGNNAIQQNAGGISHNGIIGNNNVIIDQSYNNTIQGNNNRLAATGSMIKGNYNYISSGSNITIFGNNNYVSQSCDNLILYGNNLTASAGSSNTVVYNNMSVTASNFYIQGSGSIQTIISQSVASSSITIPGVDGDILFNKNGSLGVTGPAFVGGLRYNNILNSFYAAGGDASVASSSVGLANGAATADGAVGLAGASADAVNSVAMVGANTTAGADGSFAVGNGAQTLAPDSIAIGPSIATNNYAIAMGLNTTSNGLVSVGIGNSTTADGAYSLTTNYFTSANGSKSVAMNDYTQANGVACISLGTEKSCSGDFSIVSGLRNDVGLNGDRSAIIGGADNTCNHWESVILGCHNVTSSANETVYMHRIELIDNIGHTIIMASTNGNKWALNITNAGALNIQAI